MNRELVKFKGIGVQNSLLLILDDQVEFSLLIDHIRNKFSETDGFFNDGNVIVDLGERRLNNAQKIELITLLEDDYGMQVHNLTGTDSMLYPGGQKEGQPDPRPVRPDTLFLRKTVRSGQEIKYDGNVVIMGDINPGAEVIASGNIMVFGTVRGVIHAGATGNQEAFICAVRLEPIQLRIAGYIARAPDTDNEGSGQPEVGEVIDDQLVIRSLSS